MIKKVYKLGNTYWEQILDNFYWYQPSSQQTRTVHDNLKDITLNEFTLLQMGAREVQGVVEKIGMNGISAEDFNYKLEQIVEKLNYIQTKL